jgi:RHS repeat-associated protein
MYLGKDIMRSVRSVTTEAGILEDRYEYDVFGHPYKGNLNGGMNLGYTGKPFDTATGLYNYGFRDYRPLSARFTTVDPIRDGSNWFVYVNNDPVNWIDLWGLETLQIGGYVGLGAAKGVSSSAGVIVAYDRNDPFSIEIGVYTTHGIGSYFGAGGSAGLEVITSSNSSTAGIAGSSVAINASGTLFVDISTGTVLPLGGGAPATSAGIGVGKSATILTNSVSYTNTNTYSTQLSLNPVIDAGNRAIGAVVNTVSNIGNSIGAAFSRGSKNS